MDAGAGGPRDVVAAEFERVAAGDIEGAVALVHPRARWSPTVWSAAGELRGREEVRAWFEQFGPGLEHLRIDVAAIEDAEGWVVALGTVHDTRGDSAFAIRVGWTFAVEDGLIVEGRAYESWELARAAGGLL